MQNLRLLDNNSRRQSTMMDSSDSFDDTDMLDEEDSDEESKDERHSMASVQTQQMKRISMTQSIGGRMSFHGSASTVSS